MTTATVVAMIGAAPSASAAEGVRVVRAVALSSLPVAVSSIPSRGVGSGTDAVIDPQLSPLADETPRQSIRCDISIHGLITSTYQGVGGGPLVLVDVDSDFHSTMSCNVTLRSLDDGASLRRNGTTRAYSVRDECTRCAATYSPGHDNCFGGPGICDGTYTVDGDQVLVLYSGTWGGYPDACFLATAQKLLCSLQGSVYVPPVI